MYDVAGFGIIVIAGVSVLQATGSGFWTGSLKEAAPGISAGAMDGHSNSNDLP
jgi:hypothetical protein